MARDCHLAFLLGFYGVVFPTFLLFFFGLWVYVARRYGFLSCIFVILSPMVFPSCRPVVVATAFLEALASGFLNASPSLRRCDAIES